MTLHWLAQPSIFISNNPRIFKKWKCSDHLRFLVHLEDTWKQQNTFMILAPSRQYLTHLLTISVGYTTSSKIPSWTTVRVLVRGCWTAEPFLGGLTILLVAIITTSCEKVKSTINSKYSNDLQQKCNTNYLVVLTKHMMWHQEYTPCIS
jgi:hypothetical protein